MIAVTSPVVAGPARVAGLRQRTQRIASPQPARPFAPSLPQKRAAIKPVTALDIDWSDPDTLIGAAGAVLGLAVGIGAPIFYSMRDDRDEERLEELRALNRATFKETGEYMSPEEIAEIRPPRWTDRREFVDDD